MLNESLNEMLTAAKYCIEYRKDSNGNLGWPAAVLLLSIIAAIGSYFEDDKNINIIIDNQSFKIKGTNDHFYILNSKYFNLNLSLDTVQKIYGNYRCPLIHNANLPPEHFMEIGDEKTPVITYEQINGKLMPIINTVPLYKLCEKAIKNFLNDINNVANSKQIENIETKKW